MYFKIPTEMECLMDKCIKKKKKGLAGSWFEYMLCSWYCNDLVWNQDCNFNY